MTREDIEKAARRYIAQSNNNYIPKEEDVKQAFEIGAKWRINSIWHDTSDIPDPMKECLVFLNDPMRKGWHIGRIENQGTNKGKWNIYGYFTPSTHEFITRCAYINDLTPDIEE